MSVKRKRRRSFEEVYLVVLRLLVQTASAVVGLWIMIQAPHHPGEPWLYAAAIAMMGLPAARGFESFVGLLGRFLDTFREVMKKEHEAIEAAKRPSSSKSPEENE